MVPYRQQQDFTSTLDLAKSSIGAPVQQLPAACAPALEVSLIAFRRVSG
jgi:hypothetical protein